MAEMMVAIALLGMGTLGLDSVETWTDAHELDKHRYQQAVAIAGGQLDHVNALPLESLHPTGGFVPAPWLTQADHELGAFPVQIWNADGDELEHHIYRVTVDFENADPNGVVRKLAVKVEWEDTRERTRSFALNNIRYR